MLVFGTLCWHIHWRISICFLSAGWLRRLRAWKVFDLKGVWHFHSATLVCGRQAGKKGGCYILATLVKLTSKAILVNLTSKASNAFTLTHSPAVNPWMALMAQKNVLTVFLSINLIELIPNGARGESHPVLSRRWTTSSSAEGGLLYPLGGLVQENLWTSLRLARESRQEL